MRHWIRKTYHPEIFQGHTGNKKYFEGWYIKLVSADESHAIAVIPGVALYDRQDRHAFIQVIDGIRQEAIYYRFPIEQFVASPDKFSVSIAGNHFALDAVELDLPGWKGKIQFSGLTPLRKTLLNPGIMGWYAFVPTMECYHGVVSLHHQLAGMTLGEAGTIDWSNGIGYIEKDWGVSFPKCWIWIHSNHFHEHAPVSLMASVAHIPWKGNYFPGFIVVFFLHGKEYRFATYNGSRMKCRVLENEVVMSFKRKDLQLDITARKGPTAALRTPISGRMTGKVNESMQARVEVNLFQAGTLVWEGTGTTAGLEVSGDTTILESTDWRK